MAFNSELSQLRQQIDALAGSNASSGKPHTVLDGVTPYTLAKACIILEGCENHDYARADDEPTPEEIELARQALLAQGVRLPEETPGQRQSLES